MDVGTVVIIVVLVVVLPMLFMVGGAAIAAMMGWSLHSTAEADHEGSELIDLNR